MISGGITVVFPSAILVDESVLEYLAVGHGDCVDGLARTGIV